MKNQLKLTSLILTAALAAIPALQAQSTESPAPARERGPGGPGGRGPNLEMIAEELGLSADQKAKLAPIMKHQAEQMQAIRQDESLSREQRMEKVRTIREAGRKDIEAVLTPEQAKKFADLRARGPRGDGERPRKDGKQGDK